MKNSSNAESPVRDAGTTRVYDPQRTRDALIHAAVELFGRRGFHSTSLNDIVVAAGLTKGAFYHHFESKEDILHLIHDTFMDRHLAAVASAVGDGPPSERLRLIIRDLVMTVAEYGPEVSIFFQEWRALTGHRREAVMAKRSRTQNVYEEIIRDGIKSGEFRSNLDSSVAAFGLIGMAAWMYQWYDPNGRRTPEEIARIYSEMAVRSLQA